MQPRMGLKSLRVICFEESFKNKGKMFTTKCQLAMQWYRVPVAAFQHLIGSFWQISGGCFELEPLKCNFSWSMRF